MVFGYDVSIWFFLPKAQIACDFIIPTSRYNFLMKLHKASAITSLELWDDFKKLPEKIWDLYYFYNRVCCSSTTLVSEKSNGSRFNILMKKYEFSTTVALRWRKSEENQSWAKDLLKKEELNRTWWWNKLIYSHQGNVGIYRFQNMEISIWFLRIMESYNDRKFSSYELWKLW